MKKSQKELIKDMLTKSRDQIYDEMSESDKIGYWISVAVVVAITAGILIYGIYGKQLKALFGL